MSEHKSEDSQVAFLKMCRFARVLGFLAMVAGLYVAAAGSSSEQMTGLGLMIAGAIVYSGGLIAASLAQRK